MKPDTNDRFPGELGERTHRVIGEFALLAQDLNDRERSDLAWTLALKEVAARPPTTRQRAARIMIAGNVAVYGRYFLPAKPWRLVGCEIATLDGGRIDLVWQHPDGRVMYDELKVTMGARDPFMKTGTREQGGRYLADGMARHTSFVGVRICALGAPRHSRLIAAGQLLRLCDTPYWFESSGPAGGAS